MNAARTASAYAIVWWRLSSRVNEMDEEIRGLFKALIEGQTRTDRSINELAVTVNRYVDAADARMRRIEDNLDGLIRAITREHSNGKPN
jgi:hypothetical protein